MLKHSVIVDFSHVSIQYTVSIIMKTELKNAPMLLKLHENCIRVNFVLFYNFLVYWILYICLLLILLVRLPEAKDLLTRAKQGYKGYSLESRIHFRIHAAFAQLKALGVSVNDSEEFKEAE